MPVRSRAACTTDSAMGSMMSVVAVFETSIESSAVAAITANSSARVLVPPRRTMASATRRCSPVRSMASAMNDPPSSRNSTGE